MGKLTGRSAIVTADVDEDLLIHVVDTAGTPASFKATLSQLYAVFPKNSSAGAGDVNKVPKWTATNELGASIIEDDGSTATIGGTIKITGGSPSAGKFLQCDGAGLGSWADVTAGVQVSGTPVNNQIAVWTSADTIEGDSSLTWNTAALTVTDGTDSTEIRDRYIISVSQTDDANLYLYGYGSGHRGEIVLAAANGDATTPTATLAGNNVATISAFGHSGSGGGFRQGGNISFAATEDYTEGSAYGTRFVIQTVANGSDILVTRYATDGDGNHTFTGNVKVDGQAYSAIASTVTPSALAATIDWDNGNMQVLDLQTGGNVNTLTINNPKAGASYFIKIIQGGGNTITWPAAVKWAENDEYAGSVGAGDIDAVALTYDGTSYLANYSLDYQ